MRKRSEPHTFEQRLAEQRLRLEAEAATLPHGAARDVIRKKIEQLQLAVDMNRWLSCASAADSSGSRTSTALSPSS
jgi:nitrate reductase cytochrome c-type subunit